MGEVTRRIVITPQFRQEDDGSWTGWYLEYGWSVTAATEQECLEKLKSELKEYRSNPGYKEWLQKMMSDPPDSWIVEEIGAQDAYDEVLKKLEE